MIFLDKPILVINHSGFDSHWNKPDHNLNTYHVDYMP